MRRNALLLVAVMLVQVALPMQAGAQTNPPTSPGNWTIASGDTTYYNNSQALVQGDLLVSGTLVLENSSVFLWGSNNYDRKIEVNSGGKLFVNNSVLSSYTSACILFNVKAGSEVYIDGSTIATVCRMDVKSKTMTLNNTVFEKSQLHIEPSESTAIFNQTTSITSYHLDYHFTNLEFRNSSAAGGNYIDPLWIANPHNTIDSPLVFKNLTFVVDRWNSRAIKANTAYAYKHLEFNGLEITGTYSPHSSPLTLNNPLVLMAGRWTRHIRNFTFTDAPNHMAFHGSSGTTSATMVFDNGSVSRLGIATGSETAAYPFSDTGNDALLFRIEHVNLFFSNVNLSNNIHGSYTVTSQGNYLRYYHKCSVIYTHSTETLVVSNSTITNNCDYRYYNPFNQVTAIYATNCQNIHSYQGRSHDYQYKMRYHNDYCNQWSSHTIEVYQYGGSSTPSSGKSLVVENTTIKDNNVLFHQYNSSNNYHEYRHIVMTASAVKSEYPFEIKHSLLENNSNAVISKSNYANSFNTYASNIHNYEIISIPAANTYSYVNSTTISQTCFTQSVGTHSHAVDACNLIYLEDGTVLFVNSSVGSNDFYIRGGEAIVSHFLDVRVVDPDGQWTPNASVQVMENSFWNLGTQSTGSNGGLVRFVAKHFSKTTSQFYTYTPHSISVTMANYSNSTSVNVTNYTSVIVYDPTPDAFPGDITQDWDNDSDGYGDNISGNNPDHFPNDSTQWNDTDGDGYGDNQNGNNPDRLPNDATQWNDTDGDGYGDNQSGNNPDRLPNDPTQWQDADGDGYGDNPNGNNPDAFTNDATQWSDADGDGYGDNASGNNPDAFTNDATQWADADGDGYGDNANGNDPDAFPNDATQHVDNDGDGLGDNQSGNNPDPYLNDSDNDGYDNSVDQFPWNPTQHEDLDGDGLGDNTSGTAADPYPNDTDNDGTNNSVDPFPTDATQDTDADGDGYGDNQSGNNPDPSLNDSDNDGVTNDNDAFPWNPTQTTDSDGDGWGDNYSGHPADAFPNEPSQWKDSDGDGRGDNANGTNGDAFPYDATQWSDSDGDGYGDNPNGNLPDVYPNDPTQWADSDGDGYGDNYAYTINATTGLRNQTGDAFPLDGTQWSDLDGDGYGDNMTGNAYDEYPYDPTQWVDADGDRVPDNYSYTINQTTGLRENQVGDAFPNDSTQWSDQDGDGYGDNPNGNNADAFPTDPTQWADADNDGLGDNPNGNNPDPTPGDTDNDGVPDYQDAFPNEPTQWADSDGDGYGDNWGATEWTTLRPSSWPGRFIQNAALVDYFPTIAAAHEDSDFDGFPDDWGSQDTGNNRAGLVLDACPLIFGNATTAGPGCPDGDGDNVADQDDAFPLDPSQWADADGDGYGDNQEGSFPDRFPSDPTQCCDRDGDGYGDNASAEGHDAFPDDPTQWADADGDGHGDNPSGSNADLFPDDATQWQDEDGDGLGDDPNGTNPDPYPYDGDNDAYPDEQDDCPTVAGNSSYDRKGCLDSDGDGVSDQADLWPTDPSRSLDTDGDGVNDPEDAFPDDGTQWVDNDNDGLGDNPNGNNPDPYLDDTDNDGVINQNDAFPDDPTQSKDLDGDGFGDSADGNNPDPYPNDTDNDGVPNPEDLYPLNPDQSSDSDGDGWGDNPNGSDGDMYPNDPTQCCDTDGDGWGDNPNGTMPDAFPLDPTQWMDVDKDGLGDNPDGANPDPYPNDTDNDGVPNGEDGWPTDPTKYLDSDGDGIEDGDENFLLARIPQTSTGAVLGLALFVGLAAGLGGFFLGRGKFGFDSSSDAWTEIEDDLGAELAEGEL